LNLSWIDNSTQLADRAARYVADLLENKPDAAIALPTGSTPLGMYRRLTELHAARRFSCSRARFFNLDEFVGKSIDDPQSYGAFLWQHLFRPMAVELGQVRLLRGDAPDFAAECRAFDQAIAAVGGLDLAILGLGMNGHVAFNEPGCDWDAATHKITLTEATRRAQHSLFAKEANIPRHGLTMGLRTIRSAQAILLLVCGSGKNAAVAAMLRTTPDKNWPVTAILDHPNLTILADSALNPGRPMNERDAHAAR
jgi:glucosamine-6-phosphate deaminase